MKVVIAPDSFKESLRAQQVAQAIARGWQQSFPDAEYKLVPLADGGEGTVDALVAATQGETVTTWVSDPLNRPVQASFGLLGDGKTAVIEVAAACGLDRLTPAERNPLITTSKGAGELILAALDRNVSHILIGLGGSATNDAGVGLLQTLGVQFNNAHDQPIALGGSALAQLASVDISQLDHRLKRVTIEVACDVTNPLCGPQGASTVFGPQKGANSAMVMQLEQAMGQFAKVVHQQLGTDLLKLSGGGAAGGLGAGLFAFLGAQLRPGIEMVMQAVKLADQLEGATLLITGEGHIDSQSCMGKTPVGAALLAKQHGVPVIAIGGGLSSDCQILHQYGIDAMFSAVSQICDLPSALKDAEANLVQVASNIARVWKISHAGD